MALKVVPIKHDEWLFAGKLLRPLLEQLECDTGGLFTPGDVGQRFLKGEHYIWAAADAEKDPPISAIMGAHIDVYPSGLAMLELEYCVGEGAIEVADQAAARLIEFMEKNRCDRLRGTMRKGWSRVLGKAFERLGFKLETKHIVAEVNYGRE